MQCVHPSLTSRTVATSLLPTSSGCSKLWWVTSAGLRCVGRSLTMSSLPQADDEDAFEPWNELIQVVEKLENGLTRNSSPAAIELARNVFDCLLAKFPLFFGFWKKYADMEFNIGGTEAAELVRGLLVLAVPQCRMPGGKLTCRQVYERGVASIPNSVDLWQGYCIFKTNTCHDLTIIRE